jgi:Ni,Fe-hydrogenase III small subunit
VNADKVTFHEVDAECVRLVTAEDVVERGACWQEPGLAARPYTGRVRAARLARVPRRFLPRPLRALLQPSPAEPPPPVPDEVSRALAERLDAAAQARLGRSLGVFAVEAAGCGGCALEVAALAGPHYDLERFGLRFVASPRHADVLLVSGALGRNMGEALERALLCVPEPRWVVAVGDCAADGGPFRGSYAVTGGVAEALPVDLLIPGAPPTPAQVLEGLLALLAIEGGGGDAAGKKKGRSDMSAGPWPP